MKEAFERIKYLSYTGILFFYLSLNVVPSTETTCEERPMNEAKLPEDPYDKSVIDLKAIPYKIIYETYRETDGKKNWELFLINADATNAINLTGTKDIDEMYPHVSPDGSKICFVADEGSQENKVRNVYFMNVDGTGRVKVADNARESCWSPDGKTIAYLKGEFERYTITDYATKGLFFYDLATSKHREHLNAALHHLYNICWSPDGRWFLATVHGGMGFKHAILAINSEGNGVFDLTKYEVTGCRPDFALDGRNITWGATDWDLCVAKIDLTSPAPNVTDVRRVVSCEKEHEVYHADFSPDGKYITFSYGPEANEMVGGMAPSWNICVSDLSGKWVQITTDGNHNKEPDWVPIAKSDL